MSDNIEVVQESLGYKFLNPDFLKTALTHRSYSSEYGLKYCNERMEFLGDGVLSAVVCEYLYNRYSAEDEGRLSQIKSQIVSAKNLSIWAKQIKLDQYIFVSRSEELNAARQRETLLCDSFESVVGAIYLDGGFEKASGFINRFLKTLKGFTVSDFKSTLQEKVQAVFQNLPEYRILKESGPDHDKKFEVGVYINGKLFGTGSGSSKKSAEQNAAEQALKKYSK